MNVGYVRSTIDTMKLKTMFMYCNVGHIHNEGLKHMCKYYTFSHQHNGV
jgi:hypothetical protein